MELLKGYEASYSIVVPRSLTAATYDVHKNGIAVGTTQNAVVANGLATVNVPYAASVNDGPVEVTLTFSHEGVDYKKKKTLNVVTPCLELHEIATIHPHATPQELIDVERATRRIINTHTGQEFGYEFDTVHKVRGDGGSMMRMPKKLLKFRNLAGRDSGFQVLNEGWSIKMLYTYTAPSIKADDHGFHQTGGVIYNPNNRTVNEFRDGEEYEVRGDWGWEEVPEPIREAARLLVNDYACADSAYRDRYLTSMTAADWRIQFHAGAFARTGNVRADQLLKDYVLPRGWAVI